MKKIITLALALLMLVSLAACGTTTNTPDSGVNSETNSRTNSETNSGNSGNIQGSTEKGVGFDNVTESNFAQLLKENFGIDAIYGSDWTIKEVKSPNKTNNLRINWKTPSDINSDEWTKKYFDACLEISTDGIYIVDMDMNSGALKKGEKLSDFNAYKSAGGFYGWYYYWNGRQIQANPSILAGDALVIFTFTETN